MTRANAWALVVGIDAYDDVSIPRLRGAVADACAMVRWLQAFGVPDDQILLHLAPSPDSLAGAAAVGVPYRSARDPDIWYSINDRLMPVAGGEWLLVYLAGHGLYDPSTKRLFLLQEARPPAYENMGIDLYRDLLLSFRFKQQFMIMDGCLNSRDSESQRPTVQASMHANFTGFTPRSENGWAGCFAASQGQFALEIGGGGIFTRTLLGLLNPNDPSVDAIGLDFESGSRHLDLALAMQQATAIVQAVAASQPLPLVQTPQLEELGSFASSRELPFVPLPAVPVSRVAVKVKPKAAMAAMERLRIAVDDPPYWDQRRPILPARTVAAPFTIQLPKGLAVTLAAQMRPGSGWHDQSVEQRFSSDTDQHITLAYRRSSRDEDLNRHEVRTMLPGHNQDPSPPFDIRGLGLPPGPGGIAIERVDGGRAITFDPGGDEAAAAFTERVAQRAWLGTPFEIGVEVRMLRAVEPRQNLRLVLPRGGPVGIAGALEKKPSVRIGPQRIHSTPAWRSSDALSLWDLAQSPEQTVEPGPVTVSIDLPWGSWQQSLRVPAAGQARVKLPAQVGSPPLRVRLFREARRHELLLAGIGRRPDAIWLSDSRPDRTAGRRADRGSGDWAYRLRPEDHRPQPGIVHLLVGEKTYLFPTANGPLGVEIGTGWIRVEPLSVVPEPAWDLLVGGGRLDALSASDLVNLSHQKWDDPILGVAAAYGLYAARSWKFLDQVLDNLDGLLDIPDLHVLRLAAAVRTHGRRRLAAARTTDQIPRFRWGVEIGAEVLKKQDSAWASQLSWIAGRISPVSVWTAWLGG